MHQECEVGRAPLLGRSSESISTMLKSPTERERELYNFVLLLLCPQRCTQWRTLSETESRPGFRVEWKVTGSAALGVRLLFGLRQGTGGGETKAGHPLRGTRRNLVCMLCLLPGFLLRCFYKVGGPRSSSRRSTRLQQGGTRSCKDRAHSFKRMDGAAHLRGTGGLLPPQAPS